MKYVVIGNGVAGISAVQVLNQEKNSKSTITQFTDEPYTGYYNRPKIPAFIGNYEMTVEDIIAYNLDWYRKRNVDLHIQERVERIDTETKQVFTQKMTFSYDRLLLATGADCWCPPIEGQDLKHFYTVRNLEDAIKIRKRLKESKNAVIMGGGVLGLELANAIAKQGLETTVIEFFPHLLPRQLDEEGSEILYGILEHRGINFHLGKEVLRVIGEKKVEQVITKDGLEISADLVLICTGIKPRVEIVKEILEVNRGIIVNNFLETSVKDIFAAGDCAEHDGRVYGLIPPSIQQARIAASNMVKKSKKYIGTKISSTLKVSGLLLSSFGYTGEEIQLGYESVKYTSEKEYVKLFIHNDELKAAIIIGVDKILPIIRKMYTQVKSFKENKDKLKRILPNLESI